MTLFAVVMSFELRKFLRKRSRKFVSGRVSVNPLEEK